VCECVCQHYNIKTYSQSSNNAHMFSITFAWLYVILSHVVEMLLLFPNFFLVFRPRSMHRIDAACCYKRRTFRGLSVYWAHRWAMRKQTTDRDVVRIGPKKHTLDGRARWRHLANTMDRSERRRRSDLFLTVFKNLFKGNMLIFKVPKKSTFEKNSNKVMLFRIQVDEPG